MLIKLTDGYIYSANASFCLISDIVFIRWRIFNSKTVIRKGNLMLILVLKEKGVIHYWKQGLGFFGCENQVNAWGAIYYFPKMSKFI